MVGRNLHAYPSPFTHESRMLKETKAIADAGLFEKIMIAAVWQPGLPERESLDERREVWRVRLWFGAMFGKAVRHLEWILRVYLKFRSQRVSTVNCHSLSVLPLGMLFKYGKRARVVYDTHELETETAVMSGLRKRLSKWVEARLIRRVDDVIVVSDSIAEWYRDTYGLKDIAVVRNFPMFSETAPPVDVKRRLGIPSDSILFIYQGVLGEGRGIDILLKVFLLGRITNLGQNSLQLDIGNEHTSSPVVDRTRWYMNLAAARIEGLHPRHQDLA